MNPSPRYAHTLIELLVVLVIVGILIAVTVPAIQRARASARQAQCIQQQGQLSKAVHLHLADEPYGRFPGFRGFAADGTTVASWVPQLFEYLGRRDVNGAASNPTYVELLVCPSDHGPTDAPRLSYVVNGGQPDIDSPADGVFFDHAKPVGERTYITKDEFADGLANTILLTENLDATRWDEAGETNLCVLWPLAAGDEINRGSGARPSSHHSGGFVAAFADGSVRFLAEDRFNDDPNVYTDQSIYAAMLTPGGNDAWDGGGGGGGGGGEPEPTIHVYLVAGQSNADGRGNPADLPRSPVDLQQPQTDIAYYFRIQGNGHPLSGELTTLRPGTSESGQFGPAISFGRALADATAGDAATSIAIIKYANGGTNLHSQWKAGGDSSTAGDGPEYTQFQNTVTEGLAALAAAHPEKTLRIKGIIWMQGESDTLDGTRANAYEANLTAFIDDVRQTIGSDLPFVIGRLSSAQTALNATRLQTVRDAQTAVASADPLVGIVNTDGFSLKSDDLHFDAQGQQELGSGFAAVLSGLSN